MNNPQVLSLFDIKHALWVLVVVVAGFCGNWALGAEDRLKELEKTQITMTVRLESLPAMASDIEDIEEDYRDGQIKAREEASMNIQAVLKMQSSIDRLADRIIAGQE